jgi:hypothetical protein
MRLQGGVPQVQVLEHLLESPASRGAHELFRHRRGRPPKPPLGAIPPTSASQIVPTHGPVHQTGADTFTETLKLVNTGSITVSSPITLLLHNVASDVTLISPAPAGASDSTITVSIPRSLEPGGSLVGTLVFRAKSLASVQAITFSAS